MASASRNGSAKKVDQSAVDQFCAISGADQKTGEALLEACNGNLEMALGMHLDSGGVASAPEDGASAYAAPAPDDNVRAPIPQKEEILVEDPVAVGVRSRRRAARSVFDGFRDFQAEARQQEMAGLGIPGDRRSKKRTLEDLFRPPLELLHKGSFHSARELGSNENRWLLVNIQDVKEFACQALNRDVWSNAAVKSILQEHFVFWQVYCDSEEGQKYMQFYKVVDWPYMAVLDPQTGENMVTWSKVDAVTFCDLVTEFLSSHPSPDGTTSPPAKKMKKRDSIVDASEDSQMEAAIRASLEASDNKQICDISSEESSDEDLETFSDSDDENSRQSMSGLSPSKNSVHKQSGAGKSSKSKNFKNKSSKNSSSLQSEPVINVDENTQSSLASNSSVTIMEEVASEASSTNTSGTVTNKTESNGCHWKQYLGNETDPQTELVLRFPSGKRKKLTIPCSSKLMALVQYVIEEGFSNERYELVTTFPRRKLSTLDYDDTLQTVGLQKQETVFVQER